MNRVYKQLFAVCFGILSFQANAVENPGFVFFEDGQSSVLYIKAIDSVNAFEDVYYAIRICCFSDCRDRRRHVDSMNCRRLVDSVNVFEEVKLGNRPRITR